MNFEELEEFKKDLKRLKKKYRSLSGDLLILKKILEVYPDGHPPISYRISNLRLESCIIKVKKIACKSLKGKGRNTGLRLIYAYFKEDEKIIFIELYHKSDKTTEDRERINRHFQ